MGRTIERVTIQNYGDRYMAAKGALDKSAVRTVEMDALVDTGAAFMCLPPSAIERLGLPYSRSERVRTANGIVKRRIFQGADVTIRDRDTRTDVMENDEDTPPLIGYLILEVLDFIVDPTNKTLMPNPAHGGEWSADLY